MLYLLVNKNIYSHKVATLDCSINYPTLGRSSVKVNLIQQLDESIKLSSTTMSLNNQLSYVALDKVTKHFITFVKGLFTAD